MINRAQHRVFLSSLYIGSAEGELVSGMQLYGWSCLQRFWQIKTLHRSLRSRPSLIVRLHLDLNRSTRPGPDSTARILLPLLERFPDRIHISLFRSPKLKGLMAKLVPPRFNEGWGTWHPKIYGADDTLIISG